MPGNLHWVGTWTTTPAPAQGGAFSTQTLRLKARISIGGDRLHVQLSIRSIPRRPGRASGPTLDVQRIGRTNALPSAPSPYDPSGRDAASPAGPTLTSGGGPLSGAVHTADGIGSPCAAPIARVMPWLRPSA
jgi:hypothetical protein